MKVKYSLFRSVLGLLFESKLVGVTAFSFTAVSGLKGESSIAFPADFLVAIVLFGNGSDSRIHHSTSQTEYQVKSRLFLNVVVGKTSSI